MSTTTYGDRLDLTSIKDRLRAATGVLLSRDAFAARLAEPAVVLRSSLSAGGTPVRPILCVLGWHAAGGEGDPEVVYLCAAWLELLRLSALNGAPAAGRYQAGAGLPDAGVEEALRLIRRTAKHAVERPLRIGAMLSGAGEGLLRHCSAFAMPLGEAFQLRHDLLTVFGPPSRGGEPAAGGPHEGKAAVLLAVARERASARQLSILSDLAGRPDLDSGGAVRIRQTLIDLQVPQTVEDLISARYQQALIALDSAPFAPAATIALWAIAQAMVTGSAR
jgi:geranylgeranyl pyrophosphate synthase